MRIENINKKIDLLGSNRKFNFDAVTFLNIRMITTILLTILMIILLSSLISVTILAVDSPNAETTGPSFDEPTFFSVSEKGFNIISGGGSLGKKTWYLDENKNSSFYFQGFSGELSLGIPYDISSVTDLFGANLYLFKFGYDGKFIDFNFLERWWKEWIWVFYQSCTKAPDFF